MLRGRRALLLHAAAAACLAQSELAPELLQLARIKRQMQTQLNSIVNLTCLQTIERSGSDKTGRTTRRDTLRLEVAFVNGKELSEKYVPLRFEDDRSLPETIISEHQYFVMGDHRISSNDSRMFGPVASSYIYGRAVFAYWPMAQFGAISANPSIVNAQSK